MGDSTKLTLVQHNTLMWLVNGSAGLSSETMAFWLGFEIKKNNGFFCPSDPFEIKKNNGFFCPSDPSDFKGCLNLLRAAPGLRERIGLMGMLSPQWRIITENWDAIENLLLSEVGNDPVRGGCAPETLNLMKQLINEVTNVA